MAAQHWARRPPEVTAVHYPDISAIDLTPGDPPALRGDGTPAQDGDWAVYEPTQDQWWFMTDDDFHDRYYEVN